MKDVRSSRPGRSSALELLDLTLADPRWRGRLREISRARELLCDAAWEGEKRKRWEGMYFFFLVFGGGGRRGG